MSDNTEYENNEELDRILPENQDLLTEITEEIFENLTVTSYKDPNAYSSDDKKLAKYNLGYCLHEARKLIPSDKLFGEWITENINNRIEENGGKALSQKTAYNLRLLAQFGPYNNCNVVGLSNVYKLYLPKHEELKKEVEGMLNEPAFTDKDVSDFVKSKLTPKTKFSVKEIIHALVSHVDDDLAGEIISDLTDGD